jgi:L-threonylcarbamoyladenylate synthase
MMICVGVKHAINVLKKGGIVAYPTETVYGVGALLRKDSVERVYAVKRRERNKPLSIAVSSVDMAERYAVVGDEAREFIEHLSPGPYTFVLPSRMTYEVRLVAGEKVGIRIPSHSLTLSMIEELGEAITSTSANISGTPPPTSWMEVDIEVDYILKGECELGIPSTVVDVERGVILRRGAMVEKVEKALSDFF